MKLQISFDALTLEQNLEIAQKVAQFADMLEIGTLPILKRGINESRNKELFTHIFL